MKRQNNHKRDVMHMHQHLPALTKAQIDWIAERERHECLKEYEQTKKKVSSYNHTSIITTMRGWQIVRYVLSHSECSRNGYKLHYIEEVSQRWIKLNEDKGAEVIIFEKPYSPFWYNKTISYAMHSEMTYKPWGGYERKCITAMHLAEEECYPVRRFSSDFKGTGVDLLLGRYDEIWLWHDILKNVEKTEDQTKRHYLPTMVETLFKMGEAGLANYMVCTDNLFGKREKFKKYWVSFLIARRNGFRTNFDGWMDWVDYLVDLEKLGKDIRSPKYLCPQDLGLAHAEVMEKLEEIEERKRAEATKNAIAKSECGYKKRMSKYFGLAIVTPSGITITPLQSVAEFYLEGKAMHHCVFKMGYYKHKEDLVFSAKDAEGKRVETVRIDLDRMEVAESRGLCNKPTAFHNEIVKAMEKNMWQIEQIHDSVPQVLARAS